MFFLSLFHVFCSFAPGFSVTMQPFDQKKSDLETFKTFILDTFAGGNHNKANGFSTMWSENTITSHVFPDQPFLLTLPMFSENSTYERFYVDFASANMVSCMFDFWLVDCLASANAVSCMFLLPPAMFR